MDIDMLLALIEDQEDLTVGQRLFLVKNIQHIREEFKKRFGKDIIISI